VQRGLPTIGWIGAELGRLLPDATIVLVDEDGILFGSSAQRRVLGLLPPRILVDVAPIRLLERVYTQFHTDSPLMQGTLHQLVDAAYAAWNPYGVGM
jgi:hypothetical protein